MREPFYKDNDIVIYNKDCRSMDELAGESVQMVCTSPPFFGLRKYAGDQELIWGGLNGCEHKWVREQVVAEIRTGKGLAEWSAKNARGGGHKAGQVDRLIYTHGFCSLCGAWRGAFGLEPTPEMYVQHTIEILREIRRVLRSDGVVFWNIGDSYASGKGTCYNPGGGRDSLEGHTRLKEQGAYPLDRGNKSTLEAQGLKSKDLCLVPFRIALEAQADGWWVRSIIIWQKDNPMPESVTDRPTESHEYLLMLTQSGNPLYWTHRDGDGTRKKPKADYRWVNQQTKVEVAIEPPDWKTKIKCPQCEATGKVNVCLGLDVWQEDKCPTCNGKKETLLWKRINLWRGHDYYWDADAVREPASRDWGDAGGSLLGKTGWATAAGQNDDTRNEGTKADTTSRNLRSVWTFPTTPYVGAHFAVFPERLPELCIKAATPEAGCCGKCGAPWVRQMEVTGHQVTEAMRIAGSDKGGEYHGEEQKDYGAANAQNPSETKTRILESMGEVRETVGWQPTCKCNADKVPSVVLDLFLGSGTTLWVAKRLGRHAIGYDLSEEYCQLALERNRQQALL